MMEEYHLSPDNILGLTLVEWRKKLYDQFDSPEGRFPYDIADLYSKALQNVPYNFCSILVDPDNGSINYKGSNDINEYLKGDN